MKIVVDKMHMAGHVDPWCKQHCDPRKFKELDNVCTCHIHVVRNQVYVIKH